MRKVKSWIGKILWIPKFMVRDFFVFYPGFYLIVRENVVIKDSTFNYVFFDVSPGKNQFHGLSIGMILSYIHDGKFFLLDNAKELC